MKYSDVFTYLRNQEFRSRVQFCLTKRMLTIHKNNDNTDTKGKKTKLVGRVLNNNLDMTAILSIVLAHSHFNNLDNPCTIADAKLDEVIDDTVTYLLSSAIG